MSINAGAINTFAVNEAPFSIRGSGELISIEQTVAIIESGSLISIEQDIQLRLSSTVAESVISIEQVVATTASGGVILIEQDVQDGTPDHLTRTGWDAVLYINGYKIPQSQIAGMIDIDRTEGAASLMTVTLRPSTGDQDIEFYHGKSVTLDIKVSGGTYRAFTGIVDIPEVDIYNETITLRCTDRRSELINTQLATSKATIGIYSEDIFKKPKDVAEEVEQRLTTIPYSIDFDAYGNYTLTAWAAKATADYTLTDSDVYRQRPRVAFTSRARIVNQVKIKYQYRYQRFHHTEREFDWDSPIKDDICNLLLYGYSMTFKSAVQAAAQSSGWPIVDEVTFDEIHPAGWYDCSGTVVGWSTLSLTGENIPVTDVNGNQLTGADGQPLYEFQSTGAVDYGSLYCMGANWEGSQQWAQTVTEDYTITVDAPQSQAQYGTITEDFNYAIVQETDTSEWEDNSSYRTTQPGTSNYYEDQDTNRADSNFALSVALNQAKTTILANHRDTRVSVRTFIRPEFDLKHTIYVNTDEVEAKGKVFNIKHKLNIGTGEAWTDTELRLYRAQGSTTEDPLAVPTAPSDSVTYDTSRIRLGNHFGEDPTDEDAAEWNGMVGNRWAANLNNGFRTTYTEQFIVDAPAIPDALRNERELTATASYNVEIPNDTLVINFDGKS